MTTHYSVLAGEAHGQASLAGYSLWGCTESDTTEHLIVSVLLSDVMQLEEHVLGSDCCCC